MLVNPIIMSAVDSFQSFMIMKEINLKTTQMTAIAQRLYSRVFGESKSPRGLQLLTGSDSVSHAILLSVNSFSM